MPPSVMPGLALAFWAVCLAAGSQAWPEPRTMAILGGVAVALELAARRLPGGGFIGLAFAGYLALTLVQGVGPAALALALGLALRTLWRGGTLALVSAEALSVTAALLLCSLTLMVLEVPFWMSALVGVVAHAQLMIWLLPAVEPAVEDEVERLRSEELQRTRFWPHLAGLSGVGMALLAQADPWRSLWLAVALLLLCLGGDRESADRKKLSKLKQDNLEKELERVEGLMQKASADLGRKVDECILLERLALQLSRGPTIEATLDAVISTSKELSQGDSVSVFLFEEGGLYPARYFSHLSKRVADWEIMRLSEPLVERAWETSLAQVSGGLGGTDLENSRIFRGEKRALAIPMHQVGVLYVGWKEGQGRRQDPMHLLSVVAGLAGTAINSARYFSSQQLALKNETQARAYLQEAVSGLESLRTCAQSLSSTLDPEALLDRLEESLQRLLPHHSRLVLLRWSDQAGRGRYRCGDKLVPQDSHPAADSVLKSLKPLLLDRVDKTAFPPLAPDEQSLLAVPCLCDGRPVGVLVLGARPADAFTRQHQELLGLLAYQAARNIENAALHAETVEAFRKLQESEAQLIQSAKMAAVGQLAAGVAHELNTPLGSLVLSLGSIRRLLPERWERAIERANKAEAAIENARRIVDQLLYYARDSDQTYRLADFNELTLNTVELMRPQLELDEVTVATELGDPGFVLCNKSEVQQILTALLFNARDALLEGDSEQRVVLVRTFRRGAMVGFEVEDRGCGIAAEDQTRVFDPFFTTKQVGSGTGLGLSVSQQIATQHGGQITLRSEPGVGSRFTLSLPAREECAQAG